MNKTPYFKGFSRLTGRAKRPLAQVLATQIEQIREGCPGQLQKLFPEVIQAERIEGAKGSRRRLYMAPVTAMLMVEQALCGASQREAVRELQACRAGQPGRIGSTTSSYSEARTRLPQEALDALHARVCSHLGAGANLLGERRVMVVDGTAIALDDTAANQETFPQSPRQSEGCGHPLMQVVALLNLGSGAFEHACAGPKDASESGLFQCELIDFLKPGEVLVADRLYCCFLHYAELARRGADSVMRLHQSRLWPKQLKGDDGLVIWPRPPLRDRPRHVSEAEWEALPEMLTVRYVRRRLQLPGRKEQVVMVATTLLDVPAEQILAVYLRRWDIELRLDDLKTTLGLDHLRVKTPAMAWKCFTAGLIAYNLVRLLMQDVGTGAQISLTKLSFKGTVDALLRFAPRLPRSARGQATMRQELHDAIATDLLPLRPGRIEPRVLKKRPKAFAHMTRPRVQLRQEILDSMAA